MNRNFNIFKFILKIGYDVLIAFCIVLIMVIIMQKVTDNNGSIAGYRLFTVVSGSMEPKYNIGEVVICKEMDPNDIIVGDTIVYKGLTGDIKGKTIMHDVVGINRDNDTLVFHARGLENNRDDPDIKPEQILGICIYESYLLTLIYSLATSTYASAIIITVLVLNVFLSFRTKKTNYKKLEQPKDYDVDLNKIEMIESNSQENSESKINETLENDEKNISPEQKKIIVGKYKELKIRKKLEAENRNKIEIEIKKRLKKN